MAISSYYGNSEWKTFLDYGEMSKNGLRRTIQRQFFDQDAYDHHHLALYMKDYLKCRMALRMSSLALEDIPRIDKNLLTYKVLEVFDDIREVTELGSTIFELIDGLEVARKYVSSQTPNIIMKGGEVKLENFKYSGVEISEIFRELAHELHQAYSIAQFKTVEEFIENNEQETKLLIDRSVANYLFQGGREFGTFARSFKYGLVNTYFSLEGDFAVTRYGKQMNYLCLKEFLDAYDGEFFHLYGFEAPRPLDGFKLSKDYRVIEGFFLMAPESKAQMYVERLFQDLELGRFLDSKSFSLRPAREFLSA
jgi:hypothetical protein